MAIKHGFRDRELVLPDKNYLVHKMNKLADGFEYYKKIHYFVKISLLTDGFIEEALNYNSIPEVYDKGAEILKVPLNLNYM